MWKNKHLVVALLVAPILAILAWYAVGHLIGEKPHAAKEGETYTLVGRSNCRYASGACDLHNSDFQLTLTPDLLSASSVALTLTSSHPLQSAALELVDPGDAQPPAPMMKANDAGTEWQGLLPSPSSDEARIRLAVTASGATWYAEVPVVFLSTSD